jgi:hypothetical protein
MRFLNFGETVAVRLMRALHCGFAPDPMKNSAIGPLRTVECVNLIRVEVTAGHAKISGIFQFLSFYLHLFGLN